MDASIALADAEGLDAVSMRRVAAELSTGTTSLPTDLRPCGSADHRPGDTDQLDLADNETVIEVPRAAREYYGAVSA
ncbi:hypothetical protein [Nocardia sp. NPDC050406]|uniref:hypothetical protein n=1 Tax=Nocardia sp. NPDC050406 TaxID=3364318 RepID=UPI0037B66A60